MAYWWSKLRDSIGPSPAYSVIFNLSLSLAAKRHVLLHCFLRRKRQHTAWLVTQENIRTGFGSCSPTETVPLLCREVNCCKTSSFILSLATVPELLCLCSFPSPMPYIYARQILIPFASNMKLYSKLIPAHFFSLSGLRSSLQQRKPRQPFTPSGECRASMISDAVITS